MTELLSKPPLKQSTSKPLGSLSPQQMTIDLACINDTLTSLGVPIHNGSATQIGDIRNRLLILSTKFRVELLEQYK